MMERFGLVLVATFAAGMFCGPLFCVIYSRSRRHRKLQPGPRQLKNARRQLVSVAGSSARLGAQRWEMAMGARSSGSGTYSGPSLRGTGPGGAATATAEIGTETRAAAGGDSDSPVGGGGDVTCHPYQPPGGAGEDDDDNDCPICIGPLFPRHDREEAPDTRLSTTYASSTQACISNGRDGTAGGGRDHGVLATWGQSLRRQLRIASSPLSSRARQQQQPEMASAGHGLTHSLHSRRPWRGGQSQGVHDTGRVQRSDREGIWQDDTPGSAPPPDGMSSAGANPGRNLMTTSTSPPSAAVADRTGDGEATCNLDGEGSAGATRVSQGGNVLEGIHDSDAKTRMTPVYLAAGNTGSTGSLPPPTPSAGREGGDAKTSRRNAQPLTSTIATTTGNAAVLTAPAPAVCRGDDGTAVLSPPRSSVSPRSTESGRGEPSGANTTTTTTTPRRPANAIVRASRRAAATVVEVLSPSRGVRRASLIQRRHDQEVNGDDDTDDDAGGDDFDTEILVLQGCRHAFHARCLTTWFLAEGYDCPVCRTPYWMRRERMARALQNERNGLPLDHGEDEIRARALASGYWGPMGGTAYSAIGGTIVVVRAPPTRTFTYPTDRRAWEVYLP